MSHFYDTEEGADNAVEDYIIRAEQNSITDRIYNYKNVRGSKLREGEKVKGLLMLLFCFNIRINLTVHLIETQIPIRFV